MFETCEVRNGSQFFLSPMNDNLDKSPGLPKRRLLPATRVEKHVHLQKTI